ncbi:hypothetical protein DDZ14_18195 [Maritimibacter sp. 55A14]|nr:hypothetical protein DDZ14_18195 [Maritimibacter sp. 55A14]
MWQGSTRFKIRCGPQREHPAAVARTRGEAALKRGVEPVSGRVAQDPARLRLRVPEGYQRAYPEGRLNPYRGIGTPEGQAQMEAIWTNTVPRRLVRKPVRYALAPGAAPHASSKSPWSR